MPSFDVVSELNKHELTNAVDQAYAALTGKQTDPKIGTKFTIITKANLNSADSQAAIYKTSC